MDSKRAIQNKAVVAGNLVCSKTKSANYLATIIPMPHGQNTDIIH